MNFSELYFSRCLLKRQKLLLRVCMLFKCNWLFTTSFVSFLFFWMVSCITFLLCICSLWEQWNIIFKIFFLIVLRNKLQAFLIEKITLNIVFWRFPLLLASRQKFKWCKGKTSFLSKFLTDCSSPFLWDYFLSVYPFLPNLIIQTCEKRKC